MFCFKCGLNMPETTTVCPQCGTPVANAPQPPASAAPPSAAAAQPASPWLNVPQMQPAKFQSPGPGMQARTDGKATASLVLGILSITCFWIFAGIPAIIFGHISRKNIQQSMGRLKGEGMALAGLVLGYSSILVGIPVILIIAAIAIPNLLRSRMAGNESVAMATVRNVNTAQFTYLTSFPNAGFARDLASLGPGDGDCSSAGHPSAQHACLLDNVLGGTSCTGNVWCVKSGYQFAVVGVCEANAPCSGYVITATPLQWNSTGRKSYCSTSDGVIRSVIASRMTQPMTAEDECRAWSPII